VTGPQAFDIGHARLSSGAARISGPNGAIQLEPKVTELAGLLAARAGELVTRTELIAVIWDDYPGADQSLTAAISKLRRALGECGGDPELVQTVPKRGYRLLQAEPVDPQTPDRRVLRSSRIRVLLGFGFAAALAIAAYLMIGEPPPAQARQQSIAVLPFEDLSPAGDQRWFALGIAEELLDTLARMHGVEVRARDSSFRVHDRAESTREIAEVLDVSALLDGSVRKDGDRVRITAHLIDGATGTQLWSRSYSRSLDDVFEVQASIARSVASELELRLNPDERRRMARRGTSQPAAYPFYLRGRELWERRDADSLERAIALYQEALALDPEYALAWSALAEAWLVLAELHPTAVSRGVGFRRAREAANRALEIDPWLGRPYTTLGSVALETHDWEAARQDMERALEINPDYATGHQWYALLLGSLGRNEEGLEHARRALALDPVAVQINYNLRFFLYRTGRYRELIEHMDRMQDLGIGKPATWRVWRARALIELDRLDEALAELDAAASLPHLYPESSAAVRAVALARAGDKEGARQALRDAERIAAKREPNAQGHLLVAEALVALGELDEALARVQRSGLDDLSLGYVRGRPTFARLRARPEFTRLLERVGLRP